MSLRSRNEELDQMNAKVYDVCIIGAGWAGLLACKYALQHSLSVIVLEKREHLGGVWNYTEDPDIFTVMESTITSSSATVTEAADFPFDPSLGYFIHRRDVHRYLEAYAERFLLHPHILYRQSVHHVAKHDGIWSVESQDHTCRSRNLIVCAGPNHGRREDLPELANLTASRQHIGEIKSIAPDAYGAGDHVLVYGGGESASDVIELLCKTPARITWAIPNGQHFFRKSTYFSRPAMGAYHLTDSPLDEASSKCIQHIVSFGSLTASKPGMRWLCLLGSTGSPLSYEGHGIPEWKKNVPFMHAVVNKNGHVIEFVRTGRVTARGRILSSDRDVVHYEDGTSARISHAILCTGYDTRFDFLPGHKSVPEHYKMIFDPDDPSRLLIGYARPTVSSMPLMTEIQCLYAFRVLSGQVRLPDREEMLRTIQDDIALNDRFFHQQRRPLNLVNPFIYGYDLARLGGFNPDYLRLAITSPVAFIKTFFSPAGAAQFLLQDRERRDQAVKQIWSRQRAQWFYFPLIYAISRLLQVDRILDWVAEGRYRRQVRRRKSGSPPPVGDGRTPASEDFRPMTGLEGAGSSG
jgi:dimethylaniline monooxygenase (N-oxide forming) / hypotaurine monooxygenase